MFIVVNTITAPPESLASMADAFRRTATDLRQFEGFIAFELWKGDGHLQAISKWTTREAFLEYPKSEVFRAHHKGMGVAEAIQSAQISMYEGEVLA